MRTCAIHQPNFFPHLPYFHKLWEADIFVFYDTPPAGMGKSKYWRRVRVLDNMGRQKWLGAQMSRYKPYHMLKDLLMKTTPEWRADTYNRVEAYYKKTPGFHRYGAVLKHLFTEDAANMAFADGFIPLCDFNIHCIETLMELLGVDTETYLASEIGCYASPDQQGDLIKILDYVDADTYLTGTGASLNFQDPERYADAGIELVYQHIAKYVEMHPYPQQQNHVVFTNGLSVIDPLFNIGVGGIKKLFKSYEEWAVGKTGRAQL